MGLLFSLEKDQVFIFNWSSPIFCFCIYLIMVLGNFRDASEFYCIKLLFYSCDNNAFFIDSLK